MSDDDPALRGPRSGAVLTAVALATALIFAGLLALGHWQVQRRAWKLDLIERVQQRVHAEPVAPPGPARWAHVSAARDEYRHVRLVGHWLVGRDTLVQASTVRGPGFWVMTPLRLGDGTVVLVNRGFIAPEDRAALASASGSHDGRPVTVTGLLRLSEPNWSFLRRNDAAGGRWYWRDVPAIASATGLARVAPYFVDADAASPNADPARRTDAPPPAGQGVAPLGGLTVIAFPNNHLVYAITWYTLAAMVALAAWWVGRDEWRLRSAPR